jgi:hypothetical protein
MRPPWPASHQRHDDNQSTAARKWRKELRAQQLLSLTLVEVTHQLVDSSSSSSSSST